VPLSRFAVFASGTETGGGSGLRELLENSFTGVLKGIITGVASNHENGGVKAICDEYSTPFIYRPNSEWDGQAYLDVVEKYGTDYVSLSGWIRPVFLLDPKKTFNIHPNLLKVTSSHKPIPKLGGRGMHGHHVHEAMIKAYKEGLTLYAGVSMHFVLPFDKDKMSDDKYDSGPVFFQYPVFIRDNDTADSLAQRVNKIEHGFQSYVTSLVINNEISWDGVNPESLIVPDWYEKKWNRTIDLTEYAF